MIYTRMDARLGDFAIRMLQPDADAGLVHNWVTHPKAAFWMMRDADVARVADEYTRIVEHPHHDAFIGLWRGFPAFLVERYNPAHVELVGLYDAQDGDIGMHFLCSPTINPVHCFTLAVLTTTMAWLFADPAVRRVVVEPDVRNTAVHRLNAAVGFQVVGTITKPEKKALLSTCSREQFLTAGNPAATREGGPE